MKKTLIALTLAAIGMPVLAQQKAPEPDISITGNVGIFSDYRFRGISQSDRSAAIQGGFDLTHKNGLYIGTWASSVSEFANPSNTNGSKPGGGSEVDIYGGYRASVGPLGIDIGALMYIYPGNNNKENTVNNSLKSADTTELYLGFSYGPVSYKYSHMTSAQWFTYPAASGSQYHDITVTLPVSDKVTFVAHYGMTKVKGGGNLKDFTDYKVGVAYDIGDGFILGLDYIGTGNLTSAEKTDYFTGGDKLLSTSTGVVYLKKNF